MIPSKEPHAEALVQGCGDLPAGGPMTVAVLLLSLALTTVPSSLAQDAMASVMPLPRGCLASVEELPESPLFVQRDERLTGQSLIVVLKDARRTMVFTDGRLASTAEGEPACWRVALGISNEGEHPRGAKTRRGDRKTPEGWYRSSDKPWSSFAPAVAIHYPNATDAQGGVKSGLVSEAQAQAIEQAVREDRKPSQKTRLGGEILFHGGGSRWDWTWGCVAFDDQDNDAFRSTLPTSMRTDVLILP